MILSKVESIGALVGQQLLNFTRKICSNSLKATYAGHVRSVLEEQGFALWGNPYTSSDGFAFSGSWKNPCLLNNSPIVSKDLLFLVNCKYTKNRYAISWFREFEGRC
jgi:hypothetical protein